MIKKINTTRAARSIMGAFKKSLKSNENKALLSSKDIENITDRFAKHIQQMNYNYTDWEVPENLDLLMNLPVFASLDNASINALKK